VGNFSTDSFPSNRWTSSDVLSDLAEAIQSIDAAMRHAFGFSVNSLTAPFDIDDDGSMVIQTSIAIGTSNAMIDVVDEIPASAGANEELKLAHVTAIRNFLDVQRLPGTNIDLSTSNFDNNLSSLDTTAQKAFDTLDDIDLDNLFHFDESDEFSGVDLDSIQITDRIVFEDASDSWAKKYAVVSQLASLVSGSSHTIASHSDTTATGAELETLTDGSETSLHIHDNLYVNLSGDTMTGSLAIGGNVTLDYGNTYIIEDDDGTGRNLLSIADISDVDWCSIGDAYLPVVIRGQATRPSYDDNIGGFVDLALFGDIATALADSNTGVTVDSLLIKDMAVQGTDFIDFDLTPSQSPQEGRLQWNATDKTLDLGMTGGNVTQQIGQELPIYCHNDSGGNIGNGKVVYVSGGDGTKPEISMSQADAAATTIIFGVTTEAIDNGESGYVTTTGLVRDMDTDAINVGSPAFLSSSTPGGLQATPPFAPNYKGRVGYCIVKDASVGVLYVDHSVVPLLRSLSDVETQAPAAGDCPVWSSDNSWFDMTNIGGFFNGTFIESFDATVTSNGTIITMSLEQSGGGDLTMKFSGGEYDLDCTDPAQTIALTAGASDDAPQSNYIYILESTKALTKSTSDWPSAEHIKVGYFLVPTATYVQGDGCYINQNWNDHRQGTTADVSLSNRYFNLLFWGVANKTGEYAPLMCNLPTGSYATETSANNDATGYTVTTIPSEFTSESCTGFLICKVTCHQNPSGTWTLGDTTDLRGSIPATAAGGGVGGGVLTNFPDNQFTIYDSDDVTRILDFDLSGITTGNTRTVTPSDAAMTIPDTTNWTDLTDAGDTTLHGHDIEGLTNWDGPHLPLTGGVISGNMGFQGYNTFQGHIDMDHTHGITFTYGGPTVWVKSNALKVNDADETQVGNTDYDTNIHGNSARPLYNSAALALFSDLGDYLEKDGSVALTADWDAGSHKITAEQLESDVATSTPPFIVASTTVVPNLNADLLDGFQAAAMLRVNGSLGLSADWDAGSHKITAEQLESDIATGTAPFVVASTTKVTGLNADRVDSLNGFDLLRINGDNACTGPFPLGEQPIIMTVSNDSGGGMSKGDLCYISGDSSGVPQVTLADADAVASATGALVIIHETIGNGSDGDAALFGVVTGFSGLTAGAVQYVHTTAGDFTESAPGSGDVVRVAGYAISTTEIFFNPAGTWVEVA